MTSTRPVIPVSPGPDRPVTTTAEIAALVSRWREYAATLRRYDEAGLKGDRSERARAFEDAAHELEDAMKCPYREPTEREKEQARVIVGRIVTAFGNKIRGGDAQAREHAEWVVAGFPWAFQGSTPHRDLGVDVQPHVDPWDDTPVTFPRGLLALLVEAATKADLANLLGSECESDPCPVCTALVEGYEAVHPSV